MGLDSENMVINLEKHKRMKSRQKVLKAMERFYAEVFTELEAESGKIDEAELQEFFVAVIADHLMGRLNEPDDFARVSERYCQFDNRLRSCLKHRVQSFRRYFAAEGRSSSQFC